MKTLRSWWKFSSFPTSYKSQFDKYVKGRPFNALVVHFELKKNKDATTSLMLMYKSYRTKYVLDFRWMVNSYVFWIKSGLAFQMLDSSIEEKYMKNQGTIKKGKRMAE